jgi:hypothetical protein
MAPAHGCRVPSRLLSRESTTSSLGLSRCPWARFRTPKGAIQPHPLLDQAGHRPAVVVITAAQQSDVAIARGLRLLQGRIVARDRGDLADRGVCRRHQDGGYFGTRPQLSARVQVTARCVVDRDPGVTSDHHVVLVAHKSAASPTVLRRVGDRDPATGKHEVFWTHVCHWAATMMAAIDTPRWPIELFCKESKQHLKSKTFLGTSENAVMPHIWVALSTYLILACMRFKAGLGLSFQQMRRLLQINLFDQRHLIELCTPQPHDGAASPLLRAV